ncbi:MAG: RNA chaperone Hfq [Acidobacteriota bacterium]|nr:RNA chaperone Hfq [Acidobacteriota bacterium]
MKSGAEAGAMVREPEAEGFGNRKLIRPSLSREPGVERRERPAERPAPSNGAPKKPAPAEQTHAETFYYQKQMQSKTPMVVVTREGEELHGIIEWYDKTCIKLNRDAGQSNLLVYKSAIRYMYKEGESIK